MATTAPASAERAAGATAAAEAEAEAPELGKRERRRDEAEEGETGEEEGGRCLYCGVLFCVRKLLNVFEILGALNGRVWFWLPTSALSAICCHVWLVSQPKPKRGRQR